MVPSAVGRSSGGSVHPNRDRATAGVYIGHTVGEQNAGFGTQQINENDQLVVTNRADGWQDDTLSNSQQTNETVVRFVGDTVELSYLRVKTALFDVGFHMSRPVLALAPAARGKAPWRWSVASDDGRTTASYVGRRGGIDNVEVAGRPVRCVRIIATLVLTGAVNLRVQILDDYAPSVHVDPLIVDNASGRMGALNFISKTTHRLTSLTPKAPQ